MTTITIDRATVEQALEALELGYDAAKSEADQYHAAFVGYKPQRHAQMDADVQQIAAAITALRAALAQQAEPVEPVAWSGYDLDGMVEAFSRVIEAHYQRANPFQNPVDMDAQMALRILRGFIPAMKAYAAPPQRKPERPAPCPDCHGIGYDASGQTCACQENPSF